MWNLEFPAHAIGDARDIVRQHTPPGRGMPDVNESGRLGFELRTGNYDLIERIAGDVRGRGQDVIIERVR